MPDNDKKRDLFLKRVRDVAQSEAGRVFIIDLLNFCDLYNASLKNKEDLEFYTGRRSAGVYIKSILDEIDLKLYPQMLIKSAEETQNGG